MDTQQKQQEGQRNLIFNSPVYPIPPSFQSQQLDLESTVKYLTYLGDHSCSHVMTTAGTSQFNLLSLGEIRNLNEAVSSFKGSKIFGLPPLATPHLIKEIEYLNSLDVKDAFLLIIFPERFYTNKQLVEFFTTIGNNSHYPLLAHANPIRRGSGGTYSYSNDLLRELADIPTFMGLKEESPSLDIAGTELQNLNLEIIVAGGSMKRFWSLNPFGATTYLSGVGSMFPSIEEKFFSLFSQGQLSAAKSIISQTETPFFNTTMSIGWHASMRYALETMGFIKGNRDPFAIITQKEKNRINNALSILSPK